VVTADGGQGRRVGRTSSASLATAGGRRGQALLCSSGRARSAA